jgi:hypothetical protein
MNNTTKTNMNATMNTTMTMTMKQAIATKPRDYIVCQIDKDGKIQLAEPLFCDGKKRKIKVFSRDGESELDGFEYGYVIHHTDHTITFSFFGEDEGTKKIIKYEDFDLEHYVDMFFKENKNYNLFHNNIEGTHARVVFSEETKEKIKVPFWEFLDPDNKLGRKFKKGEEPTTYYEFEFVKNDFRIGEYEGRDIIIKGYIQSGKSQMIIGGALKFFSKGLSSLIVLRNSTGDAEQLNDRFVEKLELLKASLPPKFKDVSFTLIDKITEDKLVNNGKPTIYIAIGNESPLEKYRKVIYANPALAKKFVLFVDEVDIIYSETKIRKGVEMTEKEILENKEKMTKLSIELSLIKQKAFCFFGISATIMDPLISSKIEEGNVWVMERPAYYKGIENLQRRNLLLPAKYSTLKTDDVLRNDENFEKFLEKFIEKLPGDEYISSINKEKMPKSVLFRVANTNDCNKRVLSFVAQKYKNVPIMYYSGQGVILSLPEITEPITLANGIKSSIKPIEDDRGNEIKGIYHIFNKTSPSYILQWLFENGGVEKYPHNIIFAGNLAARSISFGAANFKWCNDNGRLWWHLTHMYLTVADSMDEPELMQTAGRLCVVAKDSIPLRLFATEKTHDDINKAYWRQEELITRAKMTKDYRDMGLAIQDLPIMADKFSRRSMTKKAEYVMANKMKNTPKNLAVEKAAGGWSKDEVYNRFDEEGKVMKGKDADFEVDDFEEEKETEASESEKTGEGEASSVDESVDGDTIGDTRVNKKKLVSWFNSKKSDKQSIVSKIVQTLYELKEPISSEDLRDLLEYDGLSWESNLMSRKKGGRDGEIICVKNNMLFMNPQVRKFIDKR